MSDEKSRRFWMRLQEQVQGVLRYMERWKVKNNCLSFVLLRSFTEDKITEYI